MATINLRPWREERAKERQQKFGINLFVSAVVAVGIVLAVGYYYDLMKDRQLERNNYLRAEAKKLDKQIAEIKKLKAKRAALLERLTAIQDLQGSRPLIVRNFDELVRVLPDGVHYSSLDRKGEKVAISGRSADNLEVSALMRSIDQSIWFGEPALSSVGGAQNQKSFKLSVPLVKPKKEDEQ
jgi:type IV pilus assembly protein PilN